MQRIRSLPMLNLWLSCLALAATAAAAASVSVNVKPVRILEPSNHLNNEEEPQQQPQLRRSSSSTTTQTQRHDTDNHEENRDLIVGGTLASNNEFPWYVSTTAFGYCGASLVAPSVLLTAAHCSNLFAPGRTVRVGATQWGRGGIPRTLTSRRVVHPNYDGETLEYDMMLLQLNAPVTTIEPLEWNADDATSVPGGVDVTVMGFGRTSFEGEVSDDLLKANLLTVSDNACLGIYGFNNIDLDSMMCARYDNRDGGDADPKSACQGDSGGPLVMMAEREDGTTYPLQIGVVSWGVGCGHPRYPGVYARTSGAADWMENTICDLSPDCVLPPNSAPTPAPVPPAVNTNEIIIDIKYGANPQQMEWDILSVAANGFKTVVYTGPSYNPLPGQTWTSSFDEYPPGDYEFVVRGIEQGVSFQIKLDNADTPLGPIVIAFGSFLTSSSASFTVPDLTTAPAPTDPPTPSPTPAPVPATSTDATEAPTTSRLCQCLAGPLGCLDHICLFYEDNEEQCKEFGCTWTEGLDPDATPPPNVENPDGDGNDSTGFTEEEEINDLKKAGTAALMGLAATVGAFIAFLAIYVCCCRKRQELPTNGNGGSSSTSQPVYPVKITQSHDTEEMGYESQASYQY